MTKHVFFFSVLVAQNIQLILGLVFLPCHLFIRRVRIILFLLIDVIRLHLVSIPMGIYVTRLYLLLSEYSNNNCPLSPLLAT